MVRLRARATRAIREVLDSQGYLEIETPVLQLDHGGVDRSVDRGGIGRVIGRGLAAAGGRREAEQQRGGATCGPHDGPRLYSASDDAWKHAAPRTPCCREAPLQAWFTSGHTS